MAKAKKVPQGDGLLPEVMEKVFAPSEHLLRDWLLARMQQKIWFWELDGNVLDANTQTRISELIDGACQEHMPSGDPDERRLRRNNDFGELAERLVSCGVTSIREICDMVEKIKRDILINKKA